MGGGVAENFVECAGESSAFEHFFHETLRDFGEVVFHDAVDVFPDVAGSNCGIWGCAGSREIHAKYTEIFLPIDGRVFCILRSLGEEFCKAGRVEVAQGFAVFLECVRWNCPRHYLSEKPRICHSQWP